MTKSAKVIHSPALIVKLIRTVVRSERSFHLCIFRGNSKQIGVAIVEGQWSLLDVQHGPVTALGQVQFIVGKGISDAVLDELGDVSLEACEA